jgi:hypothetical protein
MILRSICFFSSASCPNLALSIVIMSTSLAAPNAQPANAVQVQEDLIATVKRCMQEHIDDLQVR